MQQVLELVALHWQHCDCVNASASLTRLAQLLDQQGGGAAQAAQLQHDPTFLWLLGARGCGACSACWAPQTSPQFASFPPAPADTLCAAAAAPEFSAQCVANSLAALAKLQCGSPRLAAALQAPLLRGLAGSSFTCRGIVAVLHACAKDWPNLCALWTNAWPWLLRALAAQLPQADAQAGAAPAAAAFSVCLAACSAPVKVACLLPCPQCVSTVFWALAQATQQTQGRFTAQHLEAEAPGLLAQLAAAARAQAAACTFQGLSVTVNSCSRLSPPFRQPEMLQALAGAMMRRLEEGKEQLTPQAIGLFAGGCGRLNFVPLCLWVPTHTAYVSLLDELGAQLCELLGSAKPQVRRGCGLRAASALAF